MSRLPAAGENAAGNAVLVAGTTYFLSVNTADPLTTGANEMAGVTRQAIVFATWSAGSSSNTLSITVPTPGSSAATHYSIWTLVTGGTYVTGGALASSVTAANIAFAAGAVVESVS